MKINSILLTTIIASSLFSDSAADEGALRGLKKSIAKGFMGQGQVQDGQGQDVLSFEILGGSADIGEMEEWLEAVVECLDFKAPESFSVALEKTVDNTDRRRLGRYSFRGGARRSKRDPRRLAEGDFPTGSDATACVNSGFCSKNPSNGACVAKLEVGTLTISEE